MGGFVRRIIKTFSAPSSPIKKVQPVDMFPHTDHVENVVLLKLRS